MIGGEAAKVLSPHPRGPRWPINQQPHWEATGINKGGLFSSVVYERIKKNTFESFILSYVHIYIHILQQLHSRL